jgi:RNA polymerase sigma factor (sigma-70 family)
MDALESLVMKAREGDADAYGVIVRRFQDMAVGYGYSLLRDFHLAEDAAQEAFFEAYRNLSQLREPAAFAGWFRRILFKQCDRTTRRNTVATVPLDAAHDRPAAGNDPPMKHEVLDAIHGLPEHERVTTLLFYISGYSMEEVGGFLDVPVSTVKGRLHSARNRLRAALLDSVGDGLRSRRPSRNEDFAGAVVELLKAARAGDADRVRDLLRADPRLLVARDPMGNTALIMAVNGGHQALADMLLEAGVTPGIHEAAAIGDTRRLQTWLDRDPGMLDSYSPEGFPALALAAHFGHLTSVRLLLDRGANVNNVARHRLEVTPLHAALFGRRIDAALLLIERGADVNAARAGTGWPRAGWTALHYAAGLGFEELVQPLIDRGADPSIQDEEGRTPLQVATEANHPAIAAMLTERGTK